VPKKQDERYQRLTKTQKAIRYFGFKNIDDLDQRKHEEHIAKMALKFEKNSTVNLVATSLDEFYENTTKLDSKTEKRITYIVEHTTRTYEDLFEKVDLNEADSLNLSLAHLYSFWSLLDIVRSSNIVIVDHASFFELFLEKYDGWIEESKAQKYTEEEQSEKAFWSWAKFYYYSVNMANIDLILEQFLVNNLEFLFDEGVIKKARTWKDDFTFNQKKELFYKQKGQDREGNTMSILDLYGGKLEADHLVSFKDGGETSIENGELMLRKANRSKGSNSWTPAFAHQQQLDLDESTDTEEAA
tara:strand:- start:720 stop:1619 length:900 start_codon:yes stop_codon:yes gene_type:complete